MLKREDILSQLHTLPLDLDRCWLNAGGALVLYGLRDETADIDLGAEPSLMDELVAAGFSATQKEDGNRKIHLPPVTDLFENWASGETETMDGIRVISPAGILDMKEQLNRPKDQADILRLREFLKNHTAR
ncbi:hypothetical protein [Oscillibacter ruminantium]|uniref:hypothetical protein n=1 Tax=Oscillibacter ruminantium TaxID=1263547 RepID=UPI003323B31A